MRFQNKAMMPESNQSAALWFLQQLNMSKLPLENGNYLSVVGSQECGHWSQLDTGWNLGSALHL